MQVVSVMSRVCVSLIGFMWMTALAAPLSDVERVIAIGDVHGDYAALEQLLVQIELMDEAGHWRGGNTHLVSLGDLLDRGPESRRVMDLLRRLEQQAARDGGQVHVLLGNHELMNLTGDLRDVSAAEFAAFGGREGLLAAFAANGEYGQWLLSKPAALQINDTLFVHGGLSDVFTSVDDINQRTRQHLSLLKSQAEAALAWPAATPLLELTAEIQPQLSPEFFAAASAPVFGIDGPMWYRGNALCHPLIEQPDLAANLARLGVERVVVGHTPTPTREIVNRFNGQVWMIDTGMLASVYRGKPRALELARQNGATTVRALPADVARITLAADLRTAARQRQETLLKEGAITPGEDGLLAEYEEKTLQVAFEPLSKKKRRQQLAAYRLDSALNLGLLQPLAIRSHAGRTGVLREALATVPERERDFAPQSYCYRASANGTEYDLVSIFDSLIGKSDRTAENLRYDARTRQIVLADNHGSFPTHARLQAYRQQPTLSQALAARLRSLDQAQLQALAGELLKPAQIKAILQRRDKILDWQRGRH